MKDLIKNAQRKCRVNNKPYELRCKVVFTEDGYEVIDSKCDVLNEWDVPINLSRVTVDEFIERMKRESELKGRYIHSKFSIIFYTDGDIGIDNVKVVSPYDNQYVTCTAHRRI